MRRIGVLTSDFSLYHDLVRLLRDRRIPFTSLAFGESPGPHVGVVLTSWRDSLGSRLPRDVPVVAVPVDGSGREDLDGALAQALRILEGVQGYTEVVLGVDPGHRPGLALLADGRLLHTAHVYRVADVAGLVRALLHQYPHQRSLVRVGHGAPRERDEILRGLWSLREDGVRLEVVDETGSTPETGSADHPPDVAAAIQIARTPGHPPWRVPRARASAGQVREVQRSSRAASGGRLTLAREEAERVARGERSLADALDERERPPKGKRSRSSSRSASKG